MDVGSVGWLPTTADGRLHKSITGCSGLAMLGSSITNDNVPPCSQSKKRHVSKHGLA